MKCSCQNAVLPADLTLLNARTVGCDASSLCSKVGNVLPPVSVDETQTDRQTDRALPD